MDQQGLPKGNQVETAETEIPQPQVPISTENSLQEGLNPQTISIDGKEKEGQAQKNAAEKSPTPSDLSKPVLPEEAGILTGGDIVAKGLIEDPDPATRFARTKPASYDLRIGEDVFICGQGVVKITKLSELEPVVCIEPFGTILFGTKEIINTQHHDNIVGHFGLRVSLSLQGLILQVGPQVDPGYRGRLFGLLLNTTAKPRYLNLEEKVVTIEFCYTTHACNAPKVSVDSMAEFLRVKGIDWGSLAAPNIIRQHEEEVLAATKNISEMRTEMNQLVSQYTANQGVSAGVQGVLATKRSIYIAIALFIISSITTIILTIWSVNRSSSPAQGPPAQTNASSSNALPTGSLPTASAARPTSEPGSGKTPTTNWSPK